MTLTLKDLINNGILNELAVLFHQEDIVNRLLLVIDFPTERRPIFPTSGQILDYWTNICTQIQNGILPSETGNDLQLLVNAAANFYPSNTVFSQDFSERIEENLSTPQPTNTTSSEEQESRNPESFTILIQGRDDSAQILASAQVVAPAQNILPENITLRFSRNDIVLLGLNNCDSNAAASFSEGLQTILQAGQNQVQVSVLTEDPQPYLISRIVVEISDRETVTVEDVSSDNTIGEVVQEVIVQNNPELSSDDVERIKPFTVNRINEDGSIETLNQEQTLYQANIQENERFNVVSEATEDTESNLISRIFVEGPDQARFEICDVSPNTTIGEVAKGVALEAYDSRMFQDSRGRGRPVVVDRVYEDGSTERLNQDQTLEEANIQEGDTLSFALESTAGAINPQLRQEALARVRNQIIAYAQTHQGFQVSANNNQAPTDYVFQFIAPSFAPSSEPRGQPTNIDEHEVYLALPGEFPMKAPQAFWQTPIFHPNIEPTTGFVCLGALGDRYRPGLDFGKLCQLLIDIASYQDYSVEEGYNQEAQAWATSIEGQIAIERRGGQCVLRRSLHEVQTPPRLNIRRLN